jgi:hypothetical protein
MDLVESADLKELKRRLRAGFTVAGVTVRGIQRIAPEAPESEFELLTTTDGHKANFTIVGPYPNSPIAVSAKPSSAEIHLQKQRSSCNVQSKAQDCIDFVLLMHPSLDSKGNVVLRRFVDNNRYWSEQKELVTLALNREQQLKRLHTAGGKVDGHLKVLLRELLGTRDWGGERFLPLKRQFVGLQAALAKDRRIVEKQQLLYSHSPKAQKYGDLIAAVLDMACQQDGNLIRRSIRYVDLVPFNVEDAVVRASGQRQHVEDVLGMLAKRTPMPGRKALPHLLDAYRRYCEALRPFVETLSEAICLADGLPPLSPRTTYSKRVEFIRSTRFSEIVDCLDPEIRNSESHGGTVIDDPVGRVLLTKVVRGGARQTIREYSYHQVSDMTQELQNALFPAVVFAFAFHEMGLMLMAVASDECIHALLSIDNLAD